MFIQSSDGIKIHYQTAGSDLNPVLVMVHGFYGSLDNWFDYGYVEVLAKDFFLVMVDVRGHGLSGKPTTPDPYSQTQRAQDILCVLDAIQCERAFYYGYSMGGWIAYRLMEMAPSRIVAYALAASHPYQQNIIQWNEDILSMDSWVDRLQITQQHKQRFLLNDRQALLAAAAEDRADSSPALLANQSPHLFIYGTRDPIAAKLEPLKQSNSNNQFSALEGVDHVGCLTRSDLILPIITSFFSKSNLESKS